MAPSESSMNFTEIEHGSSMLEKLRSQREEGRFCDVTLHVEGKTFRAHRSVLASCSPYFDSILKMHRVVKERLTVTCQNSQVFQCLINYMYTGHVVIDQDNVSEMLRLANHFLVNKLKYHCEEFLGKSLNISNCLSVRELAEKYHMTELSKHAVTFIQNHFQDVLKQEEILKFNSAQIQDFLADKSFGLSGLCLVSALSSWTEHSVSESLPQRESLFPSLLELAVNDWSSLSDSDISSHLDSQTLYVTSSACLLAILRHLVQSSRLPPQYQTTYQALSCKVINQAEVIPVTSLLTEQQTDSTIQNNEQQQTISEPKLPDEVGEESDRVKHRRKSGAVSHLWRSPAARLNALRRMQGRMQAIQALSSQQEDDEESEEFAEPELEGTELKYKCSICGHTCALSKEYYAHMRQMHFPGPPFTCDSCDYSCERLHLVLSHRMRHSDERPFSCPQCGFKCRTRPNLVQHQRSHEGHRPFTCEACGRSFGMKSTLEQHLATHSSDRPYLCDTCGFSTKYLSHLVAHKRIHTGEVHRCSYPQCRYSTPKRSQLESHARTHAGVRPHTCPTCGRGFLEKSHLVRHERIHLQVKPFKCGQCDYASSRRDKLKEHFNRHHGQNASAKVPYRPRPPRRGKFDESPSELLLPPSQQQAYAPTAFPPDSNMPQPDELMRHTHQQHQVAAMMFSGGQYGHHEVAAAQRSMPLVAQHSTIDYSALQTCMPLF